MDWMVERGFNPLPVTLRKRVTEAPSVESFYFDYPRDALHYQASQAFHLHLDFAHDPSFYHPFSIASSPTEDYLLFTMRRRTASPYKQTLSQCHPGDQLTVLGPVGRFVLPADGSRPIVFLGGGIGVTPFRSMMRFATDRQLPHRIVLLYSSRTPEQIVYRREWEGLQRRNPKLTVVHTITRPEQSIQAWQGRVGRIDATLVREYVEDVDQARFYLCGTPRMVWGMTRLLRTMGVGTDRIMVDVFRGYGQ
jgi:ferredoxin-NADP reductase